MVVLVMDCLTVCFCGISKIFNKILAASMDLAKKLVACQDKPELEKVVTEGRKQFSNDYKRLLTYIVEVIFHEEPKF